MRHPLARGFVAGVLAFVSILAMCAAVVVLGGLFDDPGSHESGIG